MEFASKIKGEFCVTLRPEQKESILNRLAFLETELYDLESLKSTTWETYSNVREIRRNIERIAENAANACIDIGKITLAGEITEMPATYKEVFQKLGGLKIIPDQLAEELTELVDIRNTLARQYLDLKWGKIKYFLKEGPRIVKEFASLTQKLLPPA